MHPFHPNCRCTEVAYFEGITDNERSAKNFTTGKNENIKYMTYEEWKNNYVGAETLEKYQKIDKNKYADKRQYEAYKKVLKNNPYMPKKLEDFINIKYNNIEEYTTLKFRYKLVSTDFSKMILKQQKQLNHKLDLDTNGNYTVKYGKTGILGSEKLTIYEYYDEIRKQVQNLRGTGYIYFYKDPVTNENEYREYFVQDTPYGIDILKNSNTYKYKKAFEIRYDKKLKYHITPVNEDYYKKGGKL